MIRVVHAWSHQIVHCRVEDQEIAPLAFLHIDHRGDHDPGIAGHKPPRLDLDLAAQMEHARGDLPNDRRHNLKLWGAYAFDFGLQLSANAWFRSGRPVNGFGWHPTDTWAQTYGNHSFFNGGVPCPRGCLGRTGGSWSLEVEPGVLFAEKLPKILLPKNLEVEILGQILVLEFYRKVDDVNWTYVTPPKNFTNGPRTGEFRIGGNMALEDEHGRCRLSRADFAVALIDEAEQSRYPRRRISVAY